MKSRARARSIAIAIATMMAGVAAPSIADAQAWNVPMGGRSATMGASVAEGHDVAAPLMNPAGIAAVDVQVFGLSSSLYAYTVERSHDYFVPNGVDGSYGRTNIRTADYNSSVVNTIPSAVGYFRHFGKAAVDEPGHFVLGVAALSPIQKDHPSRAVFEMDLLSQSGNLTWRKSFTEKMLDLYVGPVAGLVLSRRVRIGASLLGLYRSRDLINESNLQLSSAATATFAQERSSGSIDASSFGIVGVAGIQAQPIDHVWLGASVHAPSIQLVGSWNEAFSKLGAFTTPNQSIGLIEDKSRDLEFRSVAPPRLKLGTAYVRPKQFSIAGDITAIVGWQGADVASGTSRELTTVQNGTTRSITADFSRRTSTRTGLAFAVGVELFLSRAVALRGGYTQATDVRPLPVGSDDSLHEIRRDYYTVTTGVGLVAGPFDTTFGVAWQHSNGSVNTFDLIGSAPGPTTASSFATRELTGNTFMVLLSGAVSEERAKQQLLDRVDGLPTDVVVAAATAVLAAEKCPKTLDPAAIERFDYAAGMSVPRPDAERVRQGLLALAEARTAAQRVDADLANACRSLSADLGDPQQQQQQQQQQPLRARDACKRAGASLSQQVEQLGPKTSASVSVQKPRCEVSTATVEVCVKSCAATADASCALGCQIRAISSLTSSCTTGPQAEVRIEAADVEASERVSASIAKGITAILVAAQGIAPHLDEVLAGGERAIDGAREVSEIMQRGGVRQVVVAACVLAPLASAGDGIQALESVAAGISSIRGAARQSLKAELLSTPAR